MIIPDNGASPITASRILVIEDDQDIRKLLRRFLCLKGYSVSEAVNKVGLQRQFQSSQIDLVLLDLMLPQESGYELFRHIRQTASTPVIMITALTETKDRVTGLDLGADDYVSKPFDLTELEARIRAVLRRTEKPVSPNDALSEHIFGPWKFIPAKRALYGQSGIRVTLSSSETDLMLTFCHHPNALLTRSKIIELIYDTQNAVEERTIDLLVSRLRRKLAEGGRQLELIRTIRGDGYIFDLKSLRR
ncbi:response regulator transcription factor [Gluconobacter oxydans]|uniref:OmpR family two component response transcriptional regulator n=1 Tax=Gluconobacter oxydans NBRC 3293 TaxID=1315969 RepID=A0A829XAT1_GLUOY|nr:response regulator transcription factor [Gluconobacter oxydans]GEM17546.1 OmpR family two component response transcriptional regulator [Gluconobacter oxydans NBRC 3293]